MHYQSREPRATISETWVALHGEGSVRWARSVWFRVQGSILWREPFSYDPSVRVDETPVLWCCASANRLPLRGVSIQDFWTIGIGNAANLLYRSLPRIEPQILMASTIEYQAECDTAVELSVCHGSAIRLEHNPVLDEIQLWVASGKTRRLLFEKANLVLFLRRVDGSK